MENIIIDGIKFTVFEKDGVQYLCTGSPTGELKFAYAGEFIDYYCVVGATSVVSGHKSVDELYNDWLEATEFMRNALGIQF